MSLFLDVDTIVCRPLTEAACAVASSRADVAFVPVARGRTHRDAEVRAILDKTADDYVPAEANTGVVALRDGAAGRALLESWEASYDRRRPRCPPLAAKTESRGVFSDGQSRRRRGCDV